MEPDRIVATTILKHDPTYGVLVCLKCRYAIQRSALDSHLLRHKIYREERRRLVTSVSHLHILEPDEVPISAPTSPAIDFLPKFPGLRCTVLQCGHLTVSTKRMQLHWKQAHDSTASISEIPNLATDVTLQTFFRGNKVRYFEVESAQPADADDTESNDAGHHDLPSHDTQVHGANSTSHNASPISSFERATNPLDLAEEPDMRLLSYFHHFSTRTSLTLPFSAKSPLRERYWQDAVVVKALQCRRLMHGILALSACHMAASTDNLVERQLHHEYQEKYASKFGSQTGSAELDGATEQICVHVRCLLHLAQLSHHKPSQARANSHVPLLVSLRDIMLLNSVRPDAAQPIGARTAEEYLESQVSVDASLSGLQTLQSRMAGLLGRPKNIGDALTIIKSIDLLMETCSGVASCNDIEVYWQAAASWLKDVSPRLHEMVNSLDLVALLVMAYWSVILVSRAEIHGCWFLEGVVKASVLQLAERLVLDKHPLLPLILDFGSS